MKNTAMKIQEAGSVVTTPLNALPKVGAPATRALDLIERALAEHGLELG